MLGIAHLHSETIFPDLLSGPDAQEWVARLYATFDEIIDENGIASENTPVTPSVLRDVIGGRSFIRRLGEFSGHARLFQMSPARLKLECGNSSLPLALCHRWGIAPGGAQFRFKPLLGNLWSPSNGISIDSDESRYVSFIAGFRSVIHKQLDDLSVTYDSFILRGCRLA